MIKARHNKLYELTLDSFIRLKMMLHFREIKVHDNFHDNNLPVLLLANHASWWDGFFARQISKRIFRRKFHVMILEQELTKRKFLRRLGGFSINKSSRSMIETMQYTKGLLQDPLNLVLIFPQGVLESMHLRPLRFQKGWLRLAINYPLDVQIVFMVTLVDYGSKPRPVVSIYLENYMPQEEVTAEHAEKTFNQFMQRCIYSQTQTQ